MGNKKDYDLKVAMLVEIERHRAEMRTIKDEALAAGYTDDEYIVAAIELVTDLGGAAVISDAPKRRLNG